MMYMSDNKKHTVKVRDKTVGLKETKDLYGRLMNNRGNDAHFMDPARAT